MIYLDNAATTLYKPPEVYNTLQRLTRYHSANAGHGGHDSSLEAGRILFDAKATAANFFHISNPDQIVFCQNTTLALNMGISGLLHSGDHVIITSMEHNSVSRVVYSTPGVRVSVVPADREGYIAVSDIENAIDKDTRLIVVNHASNVTGSIQNIAAIGHMTRRQGIWFMVDAAQSAGVTEVNVKDFDIDLLAFAGHKGLYGPLGTGGLYVGETVPLRPILYGGTGSQSENQSMPDFMPDMLQAGTLNVPAFGALAAGIRFTARHATAIQQKEQYLTQQLLDGLQNCSGVTLYGNTNGQRARVGVVSFTVRGHDTVALANELNDRYHIAVRAGLHCAYLAHQSIGTEKTGTLRASVSWFNRSSDIQTFLSALQHLAKK